MNFDFSGSTVSVGLQVSLLALAVVLLLLGFATAGARLARNVVQARRQSRELRLRPILMKLLSDDEPSLAPLDALSARDRKSVEWLSWQLLTKVRGSSRETLVQWLVDQGAVERSRQRTHRRSAVARARAAEQLGAAGLKSTYPDLVRLLDDRHPDVRAVAARALGKLGDPRAVPNLLDLLDARAGVPAGIVSMALVHLGPSAVDNLISGLGSRSSAVRRVCADLLGLHGAISATRWLTAIVQHDSVVDVRVRAVGALGRIGSPHAVDALLRALSPDKPTELRVAAAGSLGLIGGRESLDALQLAISDPDDGLRAAAAEALSNFGRAGLHLLEHVATTEGRGRLAAQDQIVRKELRDARLRTRRRGRRPRQGVA